MPASINPHEHLIQTVDALRRQLGRMANAGWRGFDCSEKAVQTINQWGVPLKREALTLEGVRLLLGDCRRCGLSKNRNHIVFGSGDPHADLVFVGEGPGFEEDQAGEPFVGKAGQLLTKIIQAIGLTRREVYICNVIKCRPPENRNPAPDEIAACTPFLKQQIAALKPRFICALGAFAAQHLLDTNKGISTLRGRLHVKDGINILPTYHPAYLLRSPGKKRDVWQDMQLLMRQMKNPTTPVKPA